MRVVYANINSIKEFLRFIHIFTFLKVMKILTFIFLPDNPNKSIYARCLEEGLEVMDGAKETGIKSYIYIDGVS